GKNRRNHAHLRLTAGIAVAFVSGTVNPICDCGPVQPERVGALAGRCFLRVFRVAPIFQKLTDQVVSSYLAEPEQNRFGVINAFTNAAQRLAPLQRIEMERFAGTLLESVLCSSMRQATLLRTRRSLWALRPKSRMR